MTTIKQARLPRNGQTLPCDLPLFRWAIVCPAKHFPETPRPVRVIARRYRLPLERARIVAELAGFNLEAKNG